MEFDDAGRQVKTIQNYVNGDPTDGTPDQDVTVEQRPVPIIIPPASGVKSASRRADWSVVTKRMATQEASEGSFLNQVRGRIPRLVAEECRASRQAALRL